jgi:ATP phosphoribosyltransferase regulatory subunit
VLISTVGRRGFAPLPPGARDLLPSALRRRRALTERLLAIFGGWGYEAVATPSVEYFEVFGRGLSERERGRCVRFISPGSGELVTLRADVTPQIARLAGQRLGERLRGGESLRLAYAADVVRLPEGPRAAAEHHQVGVELIGDGSPAADAELLELAHSVLVDLGVTGARFDLAHVGIARALLDALELAPEDRDDLVARLGRKDAGAVASLLDDVAAAPGLRAAVLALIELYGSPEVLTSARERLPLASVHAAIDELIGVIARVREDAPAVAAALSVDLGEVRGFDYYSGLRVRVWLPGSPQPVVLGGRYDHLVGHYGVDAPATGFAIELDALDAALSAGLSEDERGCESGLLVAVDPGAGAAAGALAARLAEDARGSGEPVRVASALPFASAKRVAVRTGAQRIIQVTVDDGRPRCASWRRAEAGRWQQESEVR